MNDSATVQIKPFTVRPATAAALFGAPHLLQDMVKAGWVTPCYKTHRCTLYLVTDLEKCAERLAQGDRPDLEFNGLARQDKISAPSINANDSR